MLMRGSDTYFLEMSTHFSMKVATKSCFGVKNLQKFSIFNLFF